MQLKARILELEGQLKARNPSSTNAHATYASVASRPPVYTKVVLKSQKRAAPRLLRARDAPATFEKLHVKINDTRALHKCKTLRQVNSLINLTLKHIGIKKEVYRFSKIGNSVLELYFVVSNKEMILTKLYESGAEVLHDFQVSVAPTYGANANMVANTIKRLTNLCVRQGTFRNLKECIFRGHSAEIVTAVSQAIEMRNSPPLGSILTQNPQNADIHMEVSNEENSPLCAASASRD